jgi:hypothetical protein
MKKRICLFSAHAPQTGGGGAILRSLVEQLNEFSISWKYLAGKPSAGYEEGFLGKGIMGSGFKSVFSTYGMLGGKKIAEISRIVDELLQIPCDGYWIVSHNEGMRIAYELAVRQKDRPVHLTIHDDWAGALCARSTKFRWMEGQANRLTVKTIRAVNSYDVVSRGMQTYYYDLTERRGSICHRYLSPESLMPQGLSNLECIRIGHIGSLYDQDDLVSFLGMMKAYSDKNDRRFEFHMWGSQLDESSLPSDIRPSVFLHPEMPEQAVLKALASCDFNYSMYPMSPRLARFSRTSLPTKLTSYVQAGRPIFGHAPSDSTLSEFLYTTRTGVIWDSRSTNEGFEAVEKILAMRIRTSGWLEARALYFGEENLSVLRRQLAGLPALGLRSLPAIAANATIY